MLPGGLKYLLNSSVFVYVHNDNYKYLRKKLMKMATKIIMHVCDTSKQPCIQFR